MAQLLHSQFGELRAEDDKGINSGSLLINIRLESVKNFMKISVHTMLLIPGARTIRYIFIIFAACTISLNVNAIEPGARLADFSLHSDSNQVVKLSDYRGKVVLLDIWASWCEPCKHSLPWMDELQSKLGADDFQVIAVSVDSEMSAAQALLKATGVDILVAYDPKGIVPEQYNISAMPTSFLVDREGRVVDVFHGYHRRDAQQIEKRITELLTKH